MQTVAIAGASGYIGRHLVAELVRDGAYKVRVLSRDRQCSSISKRFPDSVEEVVGDFQNPTDLERFLVAGCIVVNLVYLWDATESENLTVINSLINACKTKGIARLIHVSTAAVVGRIGVDLITEDTACSPISAYGITKLKVEGVIKSGSYNNFDSAILRPTAVFGMDGEPLKKLINDLLTGSRLVNYARSCLFNDRRMNLVHILNVVAALTFLINRQNPLRGEVFIVSDDDDLKNKFSYVEQLLMSELGVSKYEVPQLRLSLDVLSVLLRILGRNNINPRCEYDSRKLRELGYKRRISLEDGLLEYVAWYRRTHFANTGTLL